MLCLSGFEVYSRWVPMQTLEIKIVIREIKRDKFKINMTQ